MTLRNLRLARWLAGMSCEAAGRLINKTPSHYSKIERGQIQLSARDALTLCTAFGLELSELLVTD